VAARGERSSLPVIVVMLIGKNVICLLFYICRTSVMNIVMTIVIVKIVRDMVINIMMNMLSPSPGV
jgi:hypothetical protein